MSKDYDIQGLFEPKPGEDPKRVYLKSLISKNVKEVKTAIQDVQKGKFSEEHIEIVLMRTYSQIYELAITPDSPSVVLEEDVFSDD